jgi:hypothetical protein
MIWYQRIAILGLLLTGCNSFPPEGRQNTVAGASVSSVTQIPISERSRTLTLEPLRKPVDGQFVIADVLSYSNVKPATAAPPGWKLLRDESAGSVHQSIYMHAIQPNDPGSSVWTFDRTVDAQGTIIVLDNVELEAPVDTTSASVGGPGIATKSMMTSSDGDLMIDFFATDFLGTGLGPQLPADMIAIADQESKPFEYWILGTYQALKGDTAPVACPSGQLYNMIAAQIAIRRRTPKAAGPAG